MVLALASPLGVTMHGAVIVNVAVAVVMIVPVAVAQPLCLSLYLSQYLWL